MLSVCGIYCNSCAHLDIECAGGCDVLKGRVYWVQHIGAEICPIYKCVKDNNQTDCGDCVKLPCETWFTLKDPALTEEEHQQSIQERVACLMSNRAKNADIDEDE